MTESEPTPTSEGESVKWWSWLTTAKEKSMSALNATKRDLSEFVTVLSTDTQKAVSGASANIKGILQKSDSSEKEASSAEPSSSRAATSSVASDIPAAPYDRCQNQLFALQNAIDTYLTDPNGDEKAFAEWKSGFDVQARQSEISNLLVSCSHVRSLHAKLVPSQVSYESFWQRYFYKVQLFQQEEERRAELMARAKPRAETWHWDEDVEEVSSPVAATKGSSSEHHRSDSSDSFICVPDDPLSEASGEKLRETADTESWASISQEQQENQSDQSKPDGPEDQVEKVDKLDRPEDLLEELNKLDLPGDQPDCPDDSGSSDWEKWDD